MNDKKKGCFTISDCGCEAIQWCESDGSEWIDFRMCKLHESAEALQAENERLRQALVDSTKIIINTSVPYREGYIWSLIHDRVSDNYAALGYTPPAITAELDLETKAGSPQPKDIDPLGLDWRNDVPTK